MDHPPATPGHELARSDAALEKKKRGEDSAGAEELGNHLQLVAELMAQDAYDPRAVVRGGFETNLGFWMRTNLALLAVGGVLLGPPMLVGARSFLDFALPTSFLIAGSMLLGPCLDQCREQRPLPFLETWARWLRRLPAVAALLAVNLLIPLVLLARLEFPLRQLLGDLAFPLLPALGLTAVVSWFYAISELMLQDRGVLASGLLGVRLAVSAPLRLLRALPRWLGSVSLGRRNPGELYLPGLFFLGYLVALAGGFSGLIFGYLVGLVLGGATVLTSLLYVVGVFSGIAFALEWTASLWTAHYLAFVAGRDPTLAELPFPDPTEPRRLEAGADEAEED